MCKELRKKIIRISCIVSLIIMCNTIIYATGYGGSSTTPQKPVQNPSTSGTGGTSSSGTGGTSSGAVSGYQSSGSSQTTSQPYGKEPTNGNGKPNTTQTPTENSSTPGSQNSGQTTVLPTNGPYSATGSPSTGQSPYSGPYGSDTGNVPTGPKPGVGKPTITKPGTSISGGDFTDPIENPGEYKPSENLSSNNTQLIERGNLVIGVIQLLGTAISVITLMTLGIRYMLAGVQEKALYKETMGPYLIGAVMVFAIPNIIAVLYDFITGNIKDI